MAPRKKCRKSGRRNSHGWKCGSRKPERSEVTIVLIEILNLAAALLELFLHGFMQERKEMEAEQA